ncbi:gag-pol polyprotein, partial [Trifolium pratense]
MKIGESIDDYFSRTLTIVNKMKMHGEVMTQGHFQSECPNWEEDNANYAEFDETEEILLMAQETKAIQSNNDSKCEIWFLDSGCSNHMVGNKDWLFDYDDIFKDSVKLGDDSKMAVIGKGNLKLCIAGFKGINVLTHKEMVQGLTHVKEPEQKCDSCMKGKQQRQSMPKKSPWRASEKLQLIHSDICGPINPESNGKKRYFITFIDDLSRKTWIYFLSEKSEALTIFQKFKAIVENETKLKIQCLRTDRGGEYTSTAFNEYCDIQGIKRQLTTSYTPQQNGVSERKNRTIMNMVRCMLKDKNVPKSFWTEAVNWSVHILNRCPTFALKDITPEEAWSGSKPSVSHFKVFGSIAYVHVPDNLRKKLDDKSIENKEIDISKGSELILDSDVCSKSKHSDEENEYEHSESMNESDENEAHNDDVADQIVLDSEDSDEGDIQPLDKRVSKRPGYLDDFVTDEVEMHNLAIFAPSTDPITYEDACKHDIWRKAMDTEIAAIESNNTWELNALPAGYSQQQGIDYNEVFAPVASVFLHGELNEEVYVDQPLGYQKKNKELVYKLKKSLYGLRQAPKACVSNPIVPGSRLQKDETGQASNATMYKQMVGCLMYLLPTRPDLAFSVCLVARYMERPTEIHMTAVKRILRYLKGTASYGFWYKRVKGEELVGWSDSDYAGDIDDRRSTSDYVFMIGTKAVSWILPQINTKGKGCITIYCDNSSSIKLSKNPVMHGRSKHIDARFHFLRDLTKDGTIQLVHCSSFEQVADIMTKALSFENFSRNREKLGLCTLEL